MTTLTTDEIIELARQAGMRLDKHNGGFIDASELKRFAKLVEAKAAEREREAMLDLVDAYAKNNTDLADAIRARGTTE